MSAPALPSTRDDAAAIFKLPQGDKREFEMVGTAATFPKHLGADVRADFFKQVAEDRFPTVTLERPTGADAGKEGDFILPRLDPMSTSLASRYRTKILGVDYSAVVAAFLAALAVARVESNPQDLIYDLVIGVAGAYTISRDLVKDYKAKGATSMLTQFEISDRKRAEDPTVGKKNAWVEDSNMNSSAIHLLGHLVVETAPRGGFLATVKSTKGTPFSPVAGGKELEKLIMEASKQLTEADKTALAAFSEECKILVSVVDALFGKAGASVELAQKAAKKVTVAFF